MALKALACWTLLGQLSGAAAEQCIRDQVGLHQHVVHTHSLAEEGLVMPSKAQTSRVSALVREGTAEMLERASALVNLSIPAAVRWALANKATQMVLRSYESPSPQAGIDLIDDLVKLYPQVAAATTGHELWESVAVLQEATKRQIDKAHFDKAGTSQALKRLVDSLGEVAGKSHADLSATGQKFVDLANETVGPAMADVFAYYKTVLEGKEHYDPAHALDLHTPVLTQLGAPSAVTEYVRATGDQIRQGKTFDLAAEESRAQRLLAQVADEVGMPPVVSETMSSIALVLDTFSPSAGKSPEQMASVLSDLYGHMVDMNAQLDGPQAVTELLQHVGKEPLSPSSQHTAEALSLVAKVIKQLDLPSVMSDFYEYMAPIVAKEGRPDTGRMQDILVQFSQQVGAPEAVADLSKDVLAQAQGSGSPPDPAKLTGLVTQLMNSLGMPAFADIFSELGGPLLQGKQPGPLALAALGPSLMKVLPDVKTAADLAKTLRAQVTDPLVPTFERVVTRLRAKMASSPSKPVKI